MSDEPANKMFDAADASMQKGADAAQTMSRGMADMSTKAMGEFSRMFSDMKMPMMPDMEALMSAHRRNLETLSAANRVALEGAQAVARRNMEIMQQTMAELTDGMRQMASGESPQARASQQAEMLKAAYERAVANMREIAELIQKSNGEALSLLNGRFTESVEEVKQLMGKAGQAGA